MTPSCPSATARSKNSCASSAESVTSRRTRSSSGTTSSSRASRSLVADSIRESPSCSSRSKKNGRIPVAPLCVAVVDAVSWNGRGRPASSRVRASPSRIRSVAGSDRVASTTSGSRAPISSRLRVKTATSSPCLCTWIRMPSSLVSTANGASTFSTPAATSGAVPASIGRTGLPTSRLKSSSASAPPVRARRRDRSGRRAEHGRAAYGLAVEVGGGRDGVEHHRVEGALADVAGDQVAQELLLGLGQAAEQRRHRVAARTHRSGAGQCADLLERRVDLDQPDGRLVGRRPAARPARASPGRCGAGAACRRGTTLRRRSPRRRRGHLTQQVGDQLALGQPRAGGGDLGGDVDEMCQQHGHIVSAATDTLSRRRRVETPAAMARAPQAPLVRVWRPDWPCPVGAILSTHRRGAGDPTFRRTSDGPIWRGIRTPEGTTTLRLLPDPLAGQVTGAAWGAGPSGSWPSCPGCWAPTTTPPASCRSTSRSRWPGGATPTGVSGPPVSSWSRSSRRSSSRR